MQDFPTQDLEDFPVIAPPERFKSNSLVSIGKLEYIFYTQIWFGECIQHLFEVENSNCIWLKLFTLNVYCVSIEFVIPNLSLLSFCTYQKIFVNC